MPRHPSVDAYLSGQKQRERKKKQKRLLLALVPAVLLAACLLVAWRVLLPFGPRAAPPQSLHSAPLSAAAPPPSSKPAAGASASKGPDYLLSPYYEEETPPLFNAANPIPDTYRPELADFTVNGRWAQLETRAAAAFQDMCAAAAEDGVLLVPISGYRPAAEQLNSYNASIQRYLGQGCSQQEAERLTRRYYALPGTSEHEAGLAMDIGDAAAPGTNIKDSFDTTDAFVWLQRHCGDYGFILRYWLGAEEVTGIAYEPWHYRYVGINHAKAIEEERLTLEDYAAGGQGGP